MHWQPSSPLGRSDGNDDSDGSNNHDDDDGHSLPPSTSRCPIIPCPVAMLLVPSIPGSVVFGAITDYSHRCHTQRHRCHHYIVAASDAVALLMHMSIVCVSKCLHHCQHAKPPTRARWHPASNAFSGSRTPSSEMASVLLHGVWTHHQYRLDRHVITPYLVDVC